MEHSTESPSFGLAPEVGALIENAQRESVRQLALFAKQNSEANAQAVGRLDSEAANLFGALDAAMTLLDSRPDLLASLVRHLSRYLDIRGFWEMRVQLMPLALDFFQKAGYDREAEQMLLGLATTLSDLGRNDQAIHTLTDAQGMPEFAQNPIALTYLFSRLGYVCMAEEKYVEAEKWYQRAQDTVDSWGAPGLVIPSLSVDYIHGLVAAVAGQGDISRAIALLAAHQHTLGSESDDIKRATILRTVGVIGLKAGAYVESLDLARQSLELAFRWDYIEGMCMSLKLLGDIHIQMGEIDEAEASLRQAHRLADSLGSDRIRDAIRTSLEIIELLRQEPGTGVAAGLTDG